MAITVEQIPAALDSVNALSSKLNDMRMLLNQAQELASKNWQIDVGSRLPLLLTVSPAQRQALVDHYETLKTRMVAEFQKLP